MQIWLNLETAETVHELAAVTAKAKECAETAERAGCVVLWGDMEIGDLSLEIDGATSALDRAADAFEREGFYPNRDDEEV